MSINGCGSTLGHGESCTKGWLCGSCEKREKAINLIIQYGGIDGAHHKDWVLDQVVRILTNCPTIKQTARDYKGQEYSYDSLGESEEYKRIIKDAKAGEDGPDTYEWSTGIPP